MSLRGFPPAALALACVLALAGPSHPAPPSPWIPPPAPPAGAARAESAAAAPTTKRPVRWINNQPDTGQFLPDTVVLARVNDRTTRVGDYVDAYYRSYAEDRPRPDSAGLRQFLNSIIDKDVMGLMVLGINRPLGFEDRLALRENRERVLSSVLFQRAVLDSATVTEEETRQLYEQFRFAVHLRHIEFADRATAERVRRDLVSGRILWKEAVRKYSVAPDSDRARDGDLGWQRRLGFDPFLAPQVFTLKPGETSPVLQDARGDQVIQVIERRPDKPPAYEALRSMMRDEIRNNKVGQRASALQAMMRGEVGMVHDTANMVWAAARFSPTKRVSREASGTTTEFVVGMPGFAPADTGRVLARHRYAQLTVGGMVDVYGAIQPLFRPSVNDFESMRSFVDGVLLEPYMAELAARRGLERDSLAVVQLQRRREEILVEHMYQDSIMSKVWVQPQARRKYYQEHLTAFFTYPTAKYAAFVGDSRAAADSLAARLRAGEKAEAMLRADSLAGRATGSIQERSANDHGTPYYRLLFEELRPGKVSVEGPDREGDFAVIQLLSFDPGRQLPYEEVEGAIDESLQNLRAEELLHEFLARHRKRFRIEAHPQLLDRVLMADRTLME